MCMEKIHTLAERIKFAREAKDMTQTALAKKSGLKQSDISKLETGRMLSTTAMVELATALECNPIWLSTGKGNPWAKKETIKNDFLIPVVGLAKLGDEGCFFAEIQTPEGGDGHILWPSSDPNAYALRCIGESMKPRIQHGEFVIVEPNRLPVPGDEVVVKDKTGRVMVKQLFTHKDGMYTFASVNSAYAPFGVPDSEIELIHYVTGIAKATLYQD